MSQVEAVLAEIAACRRPIDYTSVATRASNLLAPAQMTELYRSLDLPAYRQHRKNFRKTAAYWSHFYWKHLNWWRKTPVFRTTEVNPFVRFYEQDGAREQKSLLILVSGNGGRLFASLSIILDCLPERPMDVLFLASASRIQYRTGVVGLGDSLPEVATGIRAKFKADAYQKVQVLGVSGGAFPALQLADLMQADRGISIGGRFPYDVLRLPSLSKKRVTAYNSLCGCTAQRAKLLICTYAAGSAGDAADARLAASCCPGIKLYPVFGQVQHAFLHALYKHRQLERFLEILLTESGELPKLRAFSYFLNSIFPRA